MHYDAMAARGCHVTYKEFDFGHLDFTFAGAATSYICVVLDRVAALLFYDRGNLSYHLHRHLTRMAHAFPARIAIRSGP